MDRSFDEEPEETQTQRALKKALERAGVLKDPEQTPEVPEVPDLKVSLASLQQDLAKFAGLPTTVQEVKAYDQGLQELACQIAPQVSKVEDFLAAVIEVGLREEPVFKDQVSQAEDYLRQVEERPAFHRYVKEVKRFLRLATVRGFHELRKALENLAERGLAFKARRDPSREVPQNAVLSRENGEEFLYLPHRDSLVAQRCWWIVYNTYQQIREAGTERRQTIEGQLEVFRAETTPGLTPWKGVHEEAEGKLFLWASFKDRKTGRRRDARMIIQVSRGNFTVAQVFKPDNIEFILEQSRYRDGRIRWFPLDPTRFEPEKAPSAIAEIVWPALRDWYDDEAGRRKARAKDQEILALRETLQPLITVTRGLEGEVGHSVFHHPKAQSATRGPAHLTCHVEWTEEGFTLHRYHSWVEERGSKGPFVLDALLGKIIPRQPVEDENPQVRVLRYLLDQRRKYETWKASQAEEGENGPPSEEN